MGVIMLRSENGFINLLIRKIYTTHFIIASQRVISRIARQRQGSFMFLLLFRIVVPLYSILFESLECQRNDFNSRSELDRAEGNNRIFHRVQDPWGPSEALRSVAKHCQEPHSIRLNASVAPRGDEILRVYSSALGRQSFTS